MKKLTSILFVALMFSCSSSDEDRPITLTVGIDPDAYYEINSIVLPGNSFDTFISRGTSRTFTISEIPGGSMNVRVDFSLICESNGLDYGLVAVSSD